MGYTIPVDDHDPTDKTSKVVGLVYSVEVFTEIANSLHPRVCGAKTVYLAL